VSSQGNQSTLIKLPFTQLWLMVGNAILQLVRLIHPLQIEEHGSHTTTSSLTTDNEQCCLRE
jgi:hypothetical protein